MTSPAPAKFKLYYPKPPTVFDIDSSSGELSLSKASMIGIKGHTPIGRESSFTLRFKCQFDKDGIREAQSRTFEVKLAEDDAANLRAAVSSFNNTLEELLATRQVQPGAVLFGDVFSDGHTTIAAEFTATGGQNSTEALQLNCDYGVTRISAKPGVPFLSKLVAALFP